MFRDARMKPTPICIVFYMEHKEHFIKKYCVTSLTGRELHFLPSKKGHIQPAKANEIQLPDEQVEYSHELMAFRLIMLTKEFRGLS